MKTRSMLMIAMMISSVIFAQKGRNQQTGGEARSEKMKTELGLNDEQYASIKTINKKYAEKRMALTKDSVNRSKKMNELKSLRQQREKEIQAVLTPEQKTKWAAHKVERAANRKQKLEERVADHEARLKIDLSLSDDQFAKVQQENKLFREKLKSLRAESKAATSADKEKVKKLRTEHQAAMKAIMTKEQFEKWGEMRKEMKRNHKAKK